jgi:hypothetical protein
MQTIKNTLPSFRETRFGYESTSRDLEHTYVITYNGIDYDVTHYWSQNPQGELIGRTASPAHLAREHARKLARKHYADLQR